MRALVLLLLVLSWFPMGRAEAAVAGCTYGAWNVAYCQTEGQAFMAANAMQYPTTCFPGPVNWVTERGLGNVYNRAFIVPGGGCGQGPNYKENVGLAQWTGADCPNGTSTDTSSNLQCEAAKRHREEAIERAGLSRTYEFLSRLDAMVREACK